MLQEPTISEAVYEASIAVHCNWSAVVNKASNDFAPLFAVGRARKCRFQKRWCDQADQYDEFKNQQEQHNGNVQVSGHRSNREEYQVCESLRSARELHRKRSSLCFAELDY